MDFNTAYGKLLDSLILIINRNLGSEDQEYKNEIKTELEQLLKSIKVKLEKWTLLLLSNKIDLEEFKWLIQSQKDMVILHSLYQTGLTKNKIGRIKRDIMNRIYYDISKLNIRK